MADKQRFPPQGYLIKKGLLRFLKFVGDCMERFVRFIAGSLLFQVACSRN
jgi:hypothetical protein